VGESQQYFVSFASGTGTRAESASDDSLDFENARVGLGESGYRHGNKIRRLFPDWCSNC
jgi:hypothetical protein